MHALCSDLEGIWVPEVWINVARKTGIEELRFTTRDIKDYDELMKHRLKVLKKHGLKLKDIQNVIGTIEPLDGALEMIGWLKEMTRFVVVSDTFVEFADPLLKKLGRPLLFCNSLIVDSDNNITGYKLRQKEQKRKVIQALKSLNYKVIAIGDSYNDISMLKEADRAILANPPQNVIDDYPGFPVVHDYGKLKEILLQYFDDESL
jgi:phosphoserine/homoserine phosphotransferase